jgi:hypothetical protein
MVTGGTPQYIVDQCEGLVDVPLGMDDWRINLDTPAFSEFIHCAFDGTLVGTRSQGEFTSACMLQPALLCSPASSVSLKHMHALCAGQTLITAACQC